MIRYRGVEIDRQRLVITHNGKSHRWTKTIRTNLVFQLTCALLLGGPLNTKELFELLYGEDIDGGALDMRGAIQVRMGQLKPVLAKLDLRIGRSPGHNRRYWLEPINENP